MYNLLQQVIACSNTEEEMAEISARMTGRRHPHHPPIHQFYYVKAVAAAVHCLQVLATSSPIVHVVITGLLKVSIAGAHMASGHHIDFPLSLVKDNTTLCMLFSLWSLRPLGFPHRHILKTLNRSLLGIRDGRTLPFHPFIPHF